MIRVAVVDDQPVVVEGLLSIFSTIPALEVVRTAHTGKDFLQGLAKGPGIDVAIVDLQMPGMDGWELITRLREERPEIRSVAFSFSNDPAWIRRALGCGARAYLLKNTSPRELREVVSAVVTHGFHHSDLIARSLAGAPTRSSRPPQAIAWATVPAREMEFARMLFSTDDLTFKQIAAKMGVSVSAVENYFHWFNKHYQIHSISALVRLIMLSPPPPAS